tara:strand:+ start:344 stop:661 length:318 start_codon:yes stop_codon:yes gene_type:complete
VDPITEYFRMIYLEPKTGCGFYIRGDQSYIDIKDVHYPLQLFTRTNQMVTHKDSSFAEPVVPSSDQFEPIRIDITYSNPTYVYLVNWSDDIIGGAEVEFMTTQPE